MDVDKALATQLANIEKRTGKALAELQAIVVASGLGKHGEVVAMLNSFFNVVIGVVKRHGGFINKFVGDEALAVFGAPAVGASFRRSARVRVAVPSQVGRTRPQTMCVPYW